MSHSLRSWFSFPSSQQALKKSLNSSFQPPYPWWHMEICHILWGVDSLFHQANRPWKSHWTLHFNHLILDGIHRFISCQSCHLTIQSWNNFWKPLHSLCQSISLFEVHLLTVLESEETVTESSVELLNDSLISVDVHIPSSYPHIMHCDLTHEFMPRINLKNFWPS